MTSITDIEISRREYLALPETEWRKDYFDEATGGFVVTHHLKEKDDLRRPGIAAEVLACHKLAEIGKHILRIPENIPELIDEIRISGTPYRELLKFKSGEKDPRGYPDAFFDGQTWDFKTSTFRNDDTLRHRIKDGRKADNTIFIVSCFDDIDRIRSAIGREYGNRKKEASWNELPNVYYLLDKRLSPVWTK